MLRGQRHDLRGAAGEVRIGDDVECADALLRHVVESWSEVIIPEFAGLRDGNVTLYSGPVDFMAALERLVEEETPIGPYTGHRYRELLRQAIHGGL
jgi:hypothetical protein